MADWAGPRARVNAIRPEDLRRSIRPIAEKLGIKTLESLRKWVRQAEVDAGQRPSLCSEESAEIRRLRAEVKELRRANEILKAASALFAAELDRPLPRSRPSPASTKTCSTSSRSDACCSSTARRSRRGPTTPPRAGRRSARWSAKQDRARRIGERTGPAYQQDHVRRLHRRAGQHRPLS